MDVEALPNTADSGFLSSITSAATSTINSFKNAIPGLVVMAGDFLSRGSDSLIGDFYPSGG